MPASKTDIYDHTAAQVTKGTMGSWDGRRETGGSSYVLPFETNNRRHDDALAKGFGYLD